MVSDCHGVRYDSVGVKDLGGVGMNYELLHHFIHAQSQSFESNRANVCISTTNESYQIQGIRIFEYTKKTIVKVQPMLCMQFQSRYTLSGGSGSGIIGGGNFGGRNYVGRNGIVIICC